MRIATVLLLERMEADYHTIGSFIVEVIPGEDNCLSGSQSNGDCCVTRNVSAESQFGVNSSYLYGVGPNMVQTHVSVGRPGYQFNTDVYTRDGDTALRNSGNPMSQPLRMFQFIIGKYRLASVYLLINQIMSSLVLQTVPWIQPLSQHPLVLLPQTVKPPLSPLTPPQALLALLPQG